MTDSTTEILLLRKKLDRAMRDMRLLEDAKDRYDALYAHAMDALTASEAKYRNLSENLTEGLAMTDPSLRLTYANPAFSTIFGYGPKAPAPADLVDLAPAGNRDAFQLLFREPQAEPQEFTLTHRDGSFIPVLLSIAELLDADHAPAGFLTTFTDIRAHKQAMETRRYAQKMESLVLMAGSIAHDFNNIFQALLGNLEIAELQAHAAPEAVHTIKRAQGALRRAISLSWRMMDFSGKVISHRERLQFPELFARWAPDLCPAARNRWLAIELEDVPDISADPANLRRLVEAFLENAWEAMDEVAAPEGRVWLRVSANRGAGTALGFWAAPRPLTAATVCLEIANDGPCPPQEVLSKMFDPFFTTKALGRGLGLASALGLLQAQGAGIQVLPGGDRGIAFRLHFPPAD